MEDPEDIANAQVRFFLNYHKELLCSLILIPICLYAIVKTYNMLTIESEKSSMSDLTEPLIPTKSEGSAVSDQICQEQVMTSETSIQISFSD